MESWEDARQEAWIALLERSPEADPLDNPEAWLKRVTFYRFLEQKRKRLTEQKICKQYLEQEVKSDMVSDIILVPYHKKITRIPPGAEAFRKRNREYGKRYTQSNAGKEKRRERERRIAEAYRNRNKKIA